MPLGTVLAASALRFAGAPLRFGRYSPSGSALKSQKKKRSPQMKIRSHSAWAAVLALVVAFSLVPRAAGQNVTYKPYIQPGDNGSFAPADQMVIPCPTHELSPNPALFTFHSLN